MASEPTDRARVKPGYLVVLNFPKSIPSHMLSALSKAKVKTTTCSATKHTLWPPWLSDKNKT